MAGTVTVNDLLDGHVGLDIECMDRIYLNGYVPNLQVGGQVVSFMTGHLGLLIPSPAILEKIGTRFRRAVHQFAQDQQIPLIRFGKGDRKIEVMRRYLDAAAKTGQSRVVAVGYAQEYQNVFAANQRQGSNGVPWFSFTKADRRVTCFYFYLWDQDFGAAFIKICAYFPYPIKVWVNGHEMRQIETSRTIVFDAPRHARAFVEALVTDNLDIGRPDQLQLIFGRQLRRGTKRRTQEVFNTKVVTRDTEVTMNTFYKHSRIKQYLKDGRALRVETVINSPTDLGCHRRLCNLDELQAKARAINTRLLNTERVGQGCVLASPAFERVAQPTLDQDGRRSPALRFGDPRVMALLGALCVGLNVVGFTNRSLRALVTHLLGVTGTGYTVNQMSYDLARLRRNGLILRIPHTNTYTMTPDGQRVAVFYTKVHDRLLRPLIAADQPPAPPDLRAALKTIDRHVTAYTEHARLGTAA